MNDSTTASTARAAQIESMADVADTIHLLDLCLPTPRISVHPETAEEAQAWLAVLKDRRYRSGGEVHWVTGRFGALEVAIFLQDWAFRKPTAAPALHTWVTDLTDVVTA